MDDLIERLAMTLCLAEHDGPEYCDEPALRHWRLPARLALAEIGKTHWMVAIGDDKSGRLVRCEYEHDFITFD